MRYLLFALTLASVIGCSSEPTMIGPDNLPTKYSYVVTIPCFCTPTYVGPHRLEITGGAITSYEHIGDNDGEELDQATINSLALTALQKRAIDIINDGPHMQTVEYDPTYNFISKAYFDIDKRIADEEWGFEITEFEAK